MGCNINKLSSDIDNIIVKTIISSYSNLYNKHKELMLSKE